MKQSSVIKFVVWCMFLSSCGYNLDKIKSPPLIDPSQQEKLSSDFFSVKAAVFSPRCTSCHQQYEKYSGVIRELAAIEDSVKSNRMPKSGGPLSADQKSILFTWIANGAPEKSDISNPPNTPLPLSANWKSISENILLPKCLACHNPQGQASFLDLSSREVIFNERNRIFGSGEKLIDFDSPNESYLLQVIQDEEEPMPPVWSNIPRLTSEEVRVLTEWIRLGMP